MAFVQLDGQQLRLEPGQMVVPHGPDRELTVADARARADNKTQRTSTCTARLLRAVRTEEVALRTPTFSMEVITLPVSDLERAVRFYRDQVGFALDMSPRAGPENPDALTTGADLYSWVPEYQGIGPSLWKK